MIVFTSYSLDMATKRKKYSAKMKFEVVLALISWRMTQAEVTSEYGVHATQQSNRKQQKIIVSLDKKTRYLKQSTGHAF